MKVYVLVDATFEDYHGDDRSNVGVFSSREGAFAKVKEQLPDAAIDNPDNSWAFDEWHRLEIEEHELE